MGTISVLFCTAVCGWLSEYIHFPVMSHQRGITQTEKTEALLAFRLAASSCRYSLIREEALLRFTLTDSDDAQRIMALCLRLAPAHGIDGVAKTIGLSFNVENRGGGSTAELSPLRKGNGEGVRTWERSRYRAFSITQTDEGVLQVRLGTLNPHSRLRIGSNEITYQPLHQSLVFSDKTALMLFSIPQLLQPFPTHQHTYPSLLRSRWTREGKATPGFFTYSIPFDSGKFALFVSKGSCPLPIATAFMREGRIIYCAVYDFGPADTNNPIIFLRRVITVMSLKSGMIRAIHAKITNLSFNANRQVLRMSVPHGVAAWDIRGLKKRFLGGTIDRWPPDLTPYISFVGKKR